MTGKCFEDLKIGDAAELSRAVTEADVTAFADVTGDRNPVHLDAAFAETTPFKERIAHGMLGASMFSALLGMQLPGPGAIYVSQTLRFKRPVHFGDEMAARVEVTALDPEKARATLSCVCSVAGKAVIEGEAVVMVPRRQAAASA